MNFKEHKMLNKLKAYLAAKIASMQPQAVVAQTAPSGAPITTKEENMTIQITDTQKLTLTVSGLTAVQNPVAYSGLTATTSDATIVSATVNVDGVSVDVVAAGKLGHATVTLAVGAVTAAYEFIVIAGELASFSVVASDAVAK
jgi:hypothetical protein